MQLKMIGLVAAAVALMGCNSAIKLTGDGSTDNAPGSGTATWGYETDTVPQAIVPTETSTASTIDGRVDSGPLLRPNPRLEVSTVAGAITVLAACLVDRPSYDGSFGTTYLSLRSKDDGSLLYETNLEGIWDPKGFNEDTGAFTLIGAFQRGASLKYIDLKYLDEATHGFAVSRVMRFTPNDHESLFEANAAVASAHGRYVALIGSPGGESASDASGRFGVWVLDTTADTMRFALPAPAPPPSEDCQVTDEGTNSDPVVSKRVHATYNWEWMCVAFWYFDMEANVIRIDDHVLTVSYGRDTPSSRAKKRVMRSIALASLFASPEGKMLEGGIDSEGPR
jgi:hypothetical protein